MFVRTKSSGRYQYLQIVESRWEGGRPKQYVIATLGRLDRLKAFGQVDAIMKSLSKFSEKVKVAEGYKEGRLVALSVKKTGPDLIMGRLWKELGINEILNSLLSGRKYQFKVERAIYFTVLSRLFFPGSERKASRKGRDYKVEGTLGLDLHHFSRAMAWLGDNKDNVEEGLFLKNRDLFSGLNLVFFDTTSIYFDGSTLPFDRLRVVSEVEPLTVPVFDPESQTEGSEVEGRELVGRVLVSMVTPRIGVRMRSRWWWEL